MPDPNKWWWRLRWQVLNRAGGVCEACHVRTAEQVHHLKYPRDRREEMRDLQAVCDECHRRFHHLEAANDNEPPLLALDG